MSENNRPVAALMETLASKNGMARQHAREELVACGEIASPELIDALSDDKKILRWEAAKALTQMDAPAAIPALIETLGDDDMGVRWVAGDALLRQGRGAIKPLLQALMHDTGPIREGAYHVIHHLAHHQTECHEALMPVSDALQALEANVATSIAARKAIDTLVARGRIRS